MRIIEKNNVMMKTQAATFVRIAIGLLAMNCLSLPSSAQTPVRIRMATLAPKGTSVHQALLAMGEKWRQAPGGGAALTVYTDGSMGDEPDMVRRMRVGQLHAGTLTVQGLSDIDESVTALQNIPMLFQWFDDIDYVRGKLTPIVEKRLLDKGFVVLAWAVVGWVHFFSKKPMVHPDDL